MSLVIKQLLQPIAELQLYRQIEALVAFDDALIQQVDDIVDDVIQQIKASGDEGLIALTNQFDNRAVVSATELCIETDELQRICHSQPASIIDTIQQVAIRIRDYHQHQLQSDWQIEDEYGNKLGQKITAIEKVGIYVPGGTTSYPSSVLMNAIPAVVAGVNDITMVSPAPKGEVNPVVLAAAAIAGVDRVYTVGGAQAIAALTYGTQSMGKVDKIVGPGNLFVATAKRKLFGKVGIDMVAGPSEILIYADSGIDPLWLAKDLCSQAEHDPQAQSILLSKELAVIQAVQQNLQQLVPLLPRAEIVLQALNNRGALIQVETDQQALQVINFIAPEHLQLSVANAEQLVHQVQHAGAIFVGYYSAEVQGDYSAGPSHVLPTSTSSRFSSPLGVYDFVKRSSIIHCSASGARVLGELSSTLARLEGLEAHALSAESRAKN